MLLDARGVTAGDGNTVAMLWEVPGVIIAADAVTTLNVEPGGCGEEYADPAYSSRNAVT